MRSAPRFCADCGAAISMRVVKAGEPERAVCSAPSCARIHYGGPRVAAGLICARGDEVLLVRRGIEPGYGLWVYPGGFVDAGEAPEDAALREAVEEAGVRAAVRGLVGVYHSPHRNIVIVVYAGDVVPGCVPAALDETLEVKWVPSSALPFDDLAFDSTRAAFRDYLRGATRSVRP